jgi:hypothetical protein
MSLDFAGYNLNPIGNYPSSRRQQLSLTQVRFNAHALTLLEL